jgi:hypothetical protein
VKGTSDKKENPKNKTQGTRKKLKTQEEKLIKTRIAPLSGSNPL